MSWTARPTGLRSVPVVAAGLALAVGCLVAAPVAAQEAPPSTTTASTTTAPAPPDDAVATTTAAPTTAPPTTAVPPSPTTVPEGAEAAVAPTITAKVGVSSLRVGWSTSVSGRIEPAGSIPSVVVQRLVGGRWLDRDAGTPKADGTYRVTITPQQVATYTLRVRSGDGRVVSNTVTLKVVPVPTISASIPTSTVVVGAPVFVQGRVNPRTATPRVVAQRLIDGRWVDREAAAVNPANGTYTIAIRPTSVASYTLRVGSDKGSIASPAFGLTTKHVAFTMVDTGDARPGERVVALTFDDGPSSSSTGQLLDVLARHGVKATFSVVGQSASAYPDVLRRVVREGHHVANHAWNHPILPQLSNDAIRSQVRSTQAQIANAGYTSRCVRPPYGSRNDRVDDVIAETNASATLLWDVDPSDYRNPGTSVIVSRVMGSLHPGAIIGLHDGGGSRSQTVAAVDQLIPMIRAAGYDIRPVC